MNGQDQPISRREGDLIWKRIDDLDETMLTFRAEARENFRRLFEKVEEVNQGFRNCPVEAAKIEVLEGRVSDLSQREKNFWSRVAENLHYVVSAAALVLAGLAWAAGKF